MSSPIGWIVFTVESSAVRCSSRLPPTIEAFNVSVEITIPGGVINAKNAQSVRSQHADISDALNAVFDNVAGQLQDDALTHYGR